MEDELTALPDCWGDSKTRVLTRALNGGCGYKNYGKDNWSRKGALGLLVQGKACVCLG
jgi:hypothetical protein